MKKVTLSIFCAFSAIIIFFNLFGGMIRQSLYISVTTAKVELNFVEGKAFRVVPNEAVHTDTDGKIFVWTLSEAADIGEKYFYAEKIFTDISYKDDFYSGIRYIQEETIVIVTSASELQDKTRVKIEKEYEE
jgi:hypothetical protein